MTYVSDEDARTFAEQVNSGGASYHLLSRQFVEPGVHDGYMVGGHPNPSTGERIPELIHHGSITPEQAAEHIRTSHELTQGDPTAYAGGWAENGNSVLDTSTRFTDRKKALWAAADRGERAVFDVKAFDEIPTPTAHNAKRKDAAGRSARTAAVVSKPVRGR